MMSRRKSGLRHATTVRFDRDVWAEIVAESDRLGIAHAEYIRGAVLRVIGRKDLAARVLGLETRLEEVADEVARVARILRNELVRRRIEAGTR